MDEQRVRYAAGRNGDRTVHRVGLTRHCLASGQVQLPFALRDKIPEGELLAHDVDRDEQVPLASQPPRSLTGLRPFFAAHELQVNDILEIRTAGRELRLACVRKVRTSRDDSRTTGAGAPPGSTARDETSGGDTSGTEASRGGASRAEAPRAEPFGTGAGAHPTEETVPAGAAGSAPPARSRGRRDSPQDVPAIVERIGSVTVRRLGANAFSPPPVASLPQERTATASPGAPDEPGRSEAAPHAFGPQAPAPSGPAPSEPAEMHGREDLSDDMDQLLVADVSETAEAVGDTAVPETVDPPDSVSASVAEAFAGPLAPAAPAAAGQPAAPQTTKRSKARTRSEARARPKATGRDVEQVSLFAEAVPAGRRQAGSRSAAAPASRPSPRRPARPQPRSEARAEFAREVAVVEPPPVQESDLLDEAHLQAADDAGPHGDTAARDRERREREEALSRAGDLRSRMVRWLLEPGTPMIVQHELVEERFELPADVARDVLAGIIESPPPSLRLTVLREGMIRISRITVEQES